MHQTVLFIALYSYIWFYNIYIVGSQDKLFLLCEREILNLVKVKWDIFLKNGYIYDVLESTVLI